MNLADYLSELLGQYEEVSVPGLGYFVRERVNGYYNENEARFYPPHHKVKFVGQPKDDDTFTQYVADKKNISLASSKYFAEKFVSKLREQASTGKYLFADIGLFYIDQDQLVFKPNDKIANDPAFYGYPPVNIYKQAQSSNDEYSKLSTVEQSPAPVFISKPVQAQPQENDSYFEDETEKKKKKINIWLVILIAITAIVLAVFGLSKFYPEAFDKLGATYHRMISKADTVVPVYRRDVKRDSIKKAEPAIAKKDTVIKNILPASTPPLAAADTVKHSRFEIISNASRHFKTVATYVARLKAKNVDAKILSKTDAPGPLLKVSVGTFQSPSDAEAAKLVLVKAGKIKSNSQILEIKP
jgi:hypothetical protein